MRDFRDAKAMARALRDALKAKSIETTHAEALELIAKVFGYDNWNVLSAKIEAAETTTSNDVAIRGETTAPPQQRPLAPVSHHRDNAPCARSRHSTKAPVR